METLGCVNCRLLFGLSTVVCLVKINGEKRAMTMGLEFSGFEEMYPRVEEEDPFVREWKKAQRLLKMYAGTLSIISSDPSLGGKILGFKGSEITSSPIAIAPLVPSGLIRGLNFSGKILD